MDCFLEEISEHVRVPEELGMRGIEGPISVFNCCSIFLFISIVNIYLFMLISQTMHFRLHSKKYPIKTWQLPVEKDWTVLLVLWHIGTCMFYKILQYNIKVM